jgi:uncharacterized membrane protein
LQQLTPVFLTIHILTAIAAFGPVFVFPLIARMANQEPQSGLFALRLTDRLEKRLVIPAALTMPISGGLLVWSEGLNLADNHWLVVAIVLYVAAITFAITIQMRTVDRMIEIASGMVGAATAGAPAAAASGAALATGPGAALATSETGEARRTARYASPAAEMAALGARARNGGFFLMLMVIVIVSLMTGKPAI